MNGRNKGRERMPIPLTEETLIIERNPWEVCQEACAELSPEFIAALAKREQPSDRKRSFKAN